MASLTNRQLCILALSAGASVANLYYAQPLLAVIAQSFGATSLVGTLAAAPQIGYTFGILFFLPLGDLVDRRKLTVCLAALQVVTMLACALAPTFPILVAASLFIGFGATITQIVIPLAADLAAPERRAHAVGVVFSGLLTGLLLARTVSGFIGEWLGWRWMFALASLIALILGSVLGSSLPKVSPRTTQSYGQLLASMFGLLKKHRALQIACLMQACLFAVFSAFWSVLSLLLSKPPFEFGPAVAGAFGLIGLVGIAAANRSGRLIKRIGAYATLLIGLASCLAAFIVFPLFVSVPGLIVGIILLDFGLSIANVSNQSKILGLDESARSRINAVYVTAIFMGGACGSAVASVAWVHGGWSAVCVFGLVAALLPLVLHVACTERGKSLSNV
ncbi:putative MFS family arabinose efflux permease [Paraburkholderia sp. WC7.3g]|uniref:MFS transporter n=1 Tax=Paraburkholderia sp. WC7.3g TaxID=2991070 RepID=UPI003D1B1EAD